MAIDTMTAEEVAELLKVTTPTVYRWAREGQLPSQRLGRTLRFNRHAVEVFAGSDGEVKAASTEELVGIITDKVIEELERRGLVVKA